MSLWSFMDRCQSAMGSRMLRNWIERPLIQVDKIAKRQQAVLTLKEDFLLRDQCKEHLVYIYDMERWLVVWPMAMPVREMFYN